MQRFSASMTTKAAAGIYKDNMHDAASGTRQARTSGATGKHHRALTPGNVKAAISDRDFHARATIQMRVGQRKLHLDRIHGDINVAPR